MPLALRSTMGSSCALHTAMKISSAHSGAPAKRDAIIPPYPEANSAAKAGSGQALKVEIKRDQRYQVLCGPFEGHVPPLMADSEPAAACCMSQCPRSMASTPSCCRE